MNPTIKREIDLCDHFIAEFKSNEWAEYTENAYPEAPNPDLLVIDNSEDFGWKAPLDLILA